MGVVGQVACQGFLVREACVGVLGGGAGCLPYADPDHGGLWPPAKEGSVSSRAEGETLACRRGFECLWLLLFSVIH